MNVVSILAHQDDEMHCLGTMLKCRARGDKLFFVTLTDGSKGFVQQPGISRAAAAAIRHREMSALVHRVSGRYLNLSEPDEFLYDTPEVRLKLIEAIRKFKTDLIFTHFSVDYNADHTAVHSLVKHCAMQSCLPVLPTASRPLQKHPAVFLIEPHGPVDFPVSHYVDITSFFGKKCALLNCHRSQEVAMRKAGIGGLGELTGKVSAFRGLQTGCDHAEAFIPMPARGAVKAFNVLP